MSHGQTVPFANHAGRIGVSFSGEDCVVCHKNAAESKAGFCRRCDSLYGPVPWSQVGRNHLRKAAKK